MKKLLLGLILSSLLLSGCSQNNSKPETMEHMTSDDIISYINKGVEDVDNVFILPIPETDDNEKEITPYLKLSFEEGSDGYLDEIKLLCFSMTDEETGYSAGFYSSLLISYLAPEISEEFTEVASNNNMSWDSNDTIVTYTVLSGGASELSFIPKSEYEK